MDPAGTPAAEFTLCDREEMSPSRSVDANYVPNHEEVNLAPHGRLKSDIIKMNGKGRLLKVGNWNVRTLHRAGKLDNCIQEMTRLDIDILGIAETRWIDSGVINKDQHVMHFSGGMIKKWSKSVQGFIPISDRVMMLKIEGKPFNVVIVRCYAPTQDHSDEVIEEYYNEIQACLKLVKSTDVLIVMGDWNAKVGKEETAHITGKFGLGDRNLRGERLIQFCQEENLIVTKALFI